MALALVTGGSGFIGRHLVACLKAQGDSVRVLDVAAPPGRANDVTFVEGSVSDAAAVSGAMQGVARVYHLAGIAHFWHRDKATFDRVNRGGTEVVLKAAADAGVARVVHCSTEAILLPPYRGRAALLDESVVPVPADMPGPYTRSKLAAEAAASAAAKAGQNVVVVNPTVPIGPGDDNLTPPAVMLALFLSGGTQFYLDCMLNLVDVRDVADGIARAGAHGRSGERYILGGENVALRDLLPMLEALSGRPMPKRRVPASLAIVAGLVSEWMADWISRRPPPATREAVTLALRSAPFDCAKARRELGYAPRPIIEALTDVVEAFKRGQTGGQRK